MRKLYIQSFLFLTVTYIKKIEETVEYLKSLTSKMKIQIDEWTMKFGLWLVGVQFVDE
jgi:hypothetical protein